MTPPLMSPVIVLMVPHLCLDTDGFGITLPKKIDMPLNWEIKLNQSIFRFGDCRGLQIRPVEEQLKQRVIGERYCISRKKEVIQKKY